MRSHASGPRLRRTALATAAVAVALGLRCARPATVASSLLLDPELVAADQSSFEQPFEDGPASIRLGPGWQEPEKQWPGTDRHGIAWAEQAARIYFGVPLAPAADLVVVGIPLVYPGAPRQTLTPILNGMPLDSLPMPLDWSELRIPLPAAALISPINTLDLHFAYQAVPARHGLGTDPRSLAAAFDSLAVVPHGEPLPREARAGAGCGGLHRQELALHREPTALPLPPARQIDVELGTVHGIAGGMQLSVGLERPDGALRQLWHGAAAVATGRSLSISTRDPRPARLLLQVEGGGPRAAAMDGVWMEPPVIETVQGAERPAARPDVFVYLIDTLRADALGAYGAARPASPRIDRFSRDAIVFDHAYSSAAWTLPATFSVLSGLYPSHHGVALPGERLPPQRGPWLPELLSQSGYETLGICQWMLGGDPFGLERGFESFYLDVREAGKNRSSAIRWFLWRHLLDRRHPDRPLFVWMHAVDPHALYQPRGEDGLFARQHPGTLPAQLYDPQLFLAQGLGRRPADVEHLRALYDGEVHAADRRFGVFVDLLKFFGLYDESVIVLLSDHGEEFNEHGGFNHGRTLYDELLRVPLIVKLPQARRAGSRVAAPVSLVDVAPTIARLAGVAAVPRQPFDGVSLLAAGGGRQRPILAETRADAVDLEAVRLGAWKCIANHAGLDQFGRPAPAVQAFDLAADPRERRPLPPSAARLARCRALLHDALSTAGTATAARPQLPPDERARLRALGYVR